MNYEEMGKRICARRKAFHLSQSALAANICVSTSYLGHVERGTRKASLETIVKIANHLQTGVDFFLCDSLTEPLLQKVFSNVELSVAVQVIALFQQYRDTEL